jgi:nitroimidazol reductase NimA-like FMN-containing flavoprotein (pyridoxamine 5'-phosphate oxidase superfamily)
MTTKRTRVRRAPARGVYEREAIDAILDEGFVGHLGFVDDGQPFVIPTMYARLGDVIYVHGSSASRLVRRLSNGIQACFTVTLLDGLVLARSVFHHSMNYRSVVVLGTCRPVEGPEEREAALHAFTERLVPGRWDTVRSPSAKELKATRVLSMDLGECSAKQRIGPPVDDEPDYDLPVWAGVIPLQTVAGSLIPDPKLTPGVEPSAELSDWSPSAARTREVAEV